MKNKMNQLWLRMRKSDGFQTKPSKNDKFDKPNFPFFLRKHHWRGWGILVCDDWSQHREYVPGYRDKKSKDMKSMIFSISDISFWFSKLDFR